MPGGTPAAYNTAASGKKAFAAGSKAPPSTQIHRIAGEVGALGDNLERYPTEFIIRNAIGRSGKMTCRFPLINGYCTEEIQRQIFIE